MAISKARKDELVAQYAELIDTSNGSIFLHEYKGMTVKEMQALRGQLRSDDGAFAVTKNTLFKIALADAGLPVPEDILSGQTGASFARGDAPPIAKALLAYAKKNPNFVMKGGILNGAILSAEDVEALATLPSLDELRGKILGLITAPARNIAGTVSSGVRQIVNVLDAHVKEAA